MGADAALRVHEIMRRPIFIVEGLPDGEIGIDRHRIGDAQSRHGVLHIGDVFLKGEFGRMHAQHHQTMILVFLRPGFDVRQRPQAIDAGVGPEIHHHDLAAQDARVSGGELSHATAPFNSGIVPSTGSVLPATWVT